MNLTQPAAVVVEGAFGGQSDVVNCPIEEQEQLEEAFDYSDNAMTAISALEELQDALGDETPTEAQKQLINLTLNNYSTKFDIPTASLESDEGDEKPEVSRLKKTILYLYAVVERIFKAIFDYCRNQKLVARKIIPVARDYIGMSDSLSSAVAGQLRIRDRSIMVALHIDGIQPRKAPILFDNLVATFERQAAHSPVNELIQFVNAAKEQNPERIHAMAVKLRAKLEEGLKSGLEVVDPNSLPIFNEKKLDDTTYYASEALFGQNYIFGVIAKEVNEDASYKYRAGIRRDMEVPLRIGFFNVLTPEEIRHLCRASILVCETILRNSREEELLQKVLREAGFLTTKNPDRSATSVLKNIADAGQSSYIVHLRYTTRTMRVLMRWCAASIQKYNEVGN